MLEDEVIGKENSTFMFYVQVIETCTDIVFRNILTQVYARVGYKIAKEVVREQFK